MSSPVRTQLWNSSRQSITQHSIRASAASPRRFVSTTPSDLSSSPRVYKPSFWRSLVPKPMRSAPSGAPRAKRPRNPATPFVVLSLLIGSQAIQLIALHKDFDLFTRQTETKLALLREVIRRVQSGEEDVDIEGMLGTGNKDREREWEEVMRELEAEEELFRLRASRRKARKARKELNNEAHGAIDANVKREGVDEADYQP